MSCPECGAPFTQHRWAPAEESFLVGTEMLVDGKRMTVRCRNGHVYHVRHWVRMRSKNHRYELGERE